jgi:predicted TIM-barrel fold metal-dependent hydrolase
VKFPKLRVYIMHANPLVYPAVLDLLVQYPKVYVDVSQFQRILIREKFHRLLKEFKDAGLLGRVMLGVDGDDYGSALEAYRSAPFLNERELRGIFCENAARFLRRPELCALASDTN